MLVIRDLIDSMVEWAGAPPTGPGAAGLSPASSAASSWRASQEAKPCSPATTAVATCRASRLRTLAGSTPTAAARISVVGAVGRDRGDQHRGVHAAAIGDGRGHSNGGDSAHRCRGVGLKRTDRDGHLRRVA